MKLPEFERFQANLVFHVVPTRHLGNAQDLKDLYKDADWLKDEIRSQRYTKHIK